LEGIGKTLKSKGEFMKNNWVVLSLAAVVLAASFGFAGSKAEISIDVPFAFYAGDQLLNAGNYIVVMSSRNDLADPQIALKTKNGKTVCVLAAQQESSNDSPQNLLQFNDYGDKHFLSGISIRKFHAAVPMSEAERQMRSRTEKG
jgi:hypothetical protein